MGRLACREIGRLPEGSSAPSGTAANVGSDGPAVPGRGVRDGRNRTSCNAQGAGPHPRGPAPGTQHAHTDSTRGCYSRPARPAPVVSGLASPLDHGTKRGFVYLVHFGAVVADAPSPLSTPRCATGQAQLRLGKPLRMKCRASPVLLFMRAGKVVAGSVGIVRATVPFHGEHDAQEPTKEG